MYKYKAKVERIVVGDTFDIIIDLGFKITTHQRIRLQCLDSPEIYNVKKNTEEYKKGMAAQEFAQQGLEANNFEVTIVPEKDTRIFSRYIAIVWLSENYVSLNKELVDKDFAKAVHY